MDPTLFTCTPSPYGGVAEGGAAGLSDTVVEHWCLCYLNDGIQSHLFYSPAHSPN